MMFGKLGVHMQEKMLHLSYTTKEKLKLYEKYGCKVESHKTDRKKLEKMHFDIDVSNDFLAVTHKAKATKTKLNKRNYIKLESICKAIETITTRKKSAQYTMGKYVYNIYLVYNGKYVYNIYLL